MKQEFKEEELQLVEMVGEGTFKGVFSCRLGEETTAAVAVLKVAASRSSLIMLLLLLLFVFVVRCYIT